MHSFGTEVVAQEVACCRGGMLQWWHVAGVACCRGGMLQEWHVAGVATTWIDKGGPPLSTSYIMHAHANSVVLKKSSLFMTQIIFGRNNIIFNVVRQCT